MENKELQEKLKEIRVQAKTQVILLISSLFLIFLWFTYFSWSLNQKTFSAEATESVADAVKVSSSNMVPITFIIAILFTIFYLILMKMFTPTLIKRHEE